MFNDSIYRTGSNDEPDLFIITDLKSSGFWLQEKKVSEVDYRAYA